MSEQAPNKEGNEGGSVTVALPAVEIRRNPDNTIDEIIAKGCMVHIEQMSSDSWYMGIDAADGSYWQFWFGAKNRKSHVEFKHTEMMPARAAKDTP